MRMPAPSTSVFGVLIAAVALSLEGATEPALTSSAASRPTTRASGGPLTPQTAAIAEVNRGNYHKIAQAIDDVYTDSEVRVLRDRAMSFYNESFAVSVTKLSSAERRAALLQAESLMADTRDLLQRRLEADPKNVGLRSEINLALTEMAFRRRSYEFVMALAPKYIERAQPGRIRAQLYHFYHQASLRSSDRKRGAVVGEPPVAPRNVDLPTVIWADFANMEPELSGEYRNGTPQGRVRESIETFSRSYDYDLLSLTEPYEVVVQSIIPTRDRLLALAAELGRPLASHDGSRRP